MLGLMLLIGRLFLKIIKRKIKKKTGLGSGKKGFVNKWVFKYSLEGHRLGYIGCRCFGYLDFDELGGLGLVDLVVA